ncbi:hypothetical protein OG762_04055 [Streptomyces sp. NBC_01136]|uniref:hypothetical protein n=1 Tax=unclassified Streptomyces TaxID=2593676 RepID=UPI003253F5A6|nr:hypothetical protein OG762_04055 [Streptomyces sp. NBC_01136]
MPMWPAVSTPPMTASRGTSIRAARAQESDTGTRQSVSVRMRLSVRVCLEIVRVAISRSRRTRVGSTSA